MWTALFVMLRATRSYITDFPEVSLCTDPISQKSIGRLYKGCSLLLSLSLPIKILNIKFCPSGHLTNKIIFIISLALHCSTPAGLSIIVLTSQYTKVSCIVYRVFQYIHENNFRQYANTRIATNTRSIHEMPIHDENQIHDRFEWRLFDLVVISVANDKWLPALMRLLAIYMRWEYLKD